MPDHDLSRRTLLGALAFGTLSVTVVSGCGGHDKKTSTPPTVPVPSGPGKVVSAEHYGAHGDGTTDDTQALAAAVRDVNAAGGGTVELLGSAVGYVVRGLTLLSGVRLAGTGGSATVLKLGASSRWLSTAPGATAVSLSDLTLQTQGLVHGYAVLAGAGTTAFRVEGCSLHGDLSNQAIGVECGPGCRDVRVVKTVLDSFRTAIRLNSCAGDAVVSGCTIDNWLDRGITVRGTPGAAPRNVQIVSNTIGANSPGGNSRQGIAFSSVGGAVFRDVQVRANTVTGAGVDDKDPSLAGSADLISLHRCTTFTVSDNIVSSGGEVGITVAQGCSHGVVRNNTCTRNDTAGIAIGSRSGDPVTTVTVEGNTCVDNGQDYGGTGQGDSAHSGITVYGAEAVNLRNNTLTSTQPGAQSIGISVIGGHGNQVQDDNTVTGPVTTAVLRRGAGSDDLGP